MKSMADYKTLCDRYSKIKNEMEEAANYLAKFSASVSERRTFSDSFVNTRQCSTLTGRDPSLQTTAKRSNLKRSPESSDETNQSEDESPCKSAALQSAVVSKLKKAVSRKETILKQNANRNIRLRNRKFLGLVQSTLRTFQAEEVKRQPQDLKRIKALEKVEAAVEEEKELAKKQTQELRSKLKEYHLEIQCLERMMTITQSFELWENNQKYLQNYILTDAEPRVYFLPVTHTSRSQKCLERSREEIKENISKQRADVEIALMNVRESYQTYPPKEIFPLDEVYNFQRVTEETAKQCTEDTLKLELSDDESDVIKMLY